VIVGGTTLAGYDARTGDKEWETSSDPPSEISALIEHRDRVFAAGTTSGPFAQRDLLVAAFHPKTGRQLWSDRVDYAGGIDFADAVAAGGGRVFVVGITLEPDTFRPSAFIRAYDVRTGAHLWNDLVDLGLGSAFLTATEVEGQVYLVAGIDGAGGGTAPFIIRAYNARTGALVWQDAPPGSDGATVIAADHRRVFTGGTQADQRGFVVRGYDRRDGRLIWEDSFFGGDISLVTGIALHKGRLLVSGVAGGLNVAPKNDNDPNVGSFVRAYDPKTGTVLWEEAAHAEGRGFVYLSLAAARDSVVVVGSRIEVGPGVPGFFSQRFSVRARDIETGALQWEDLVGETPGNAVAVEARNGALVIAIGEATHLDDVTRSVMRAYDAAKHSQKSR
jgi:outer membrane protein assembly factor BamB